MLLLVSLAFARALSLVSRSRITTAEISVPMIGMSAMRSSPVAVVSIARLARVSVSLSWLRPWIYAAVVSARATHTTAHAKSAISHRRTEARGAAEPDSGAAMQELYPAAVPSTRGRGHAFRMRPMSS